MIDHPVPEVLQPWSHRTGHGFTVRGYITADTGKPLIHFLHGNGFSGLTYWAMLTHLLDDFDIMLSDVQGHGDSDAGDRFIGWNQNAELIGNVLQSKIRERENPHVYGVAHSFGGALTTLMAAKHPALFDRLVLLDPVYFPSEMIFVMSGLHLLGLSSRMPLPKQARRRQQSWASRSAAEHYFRGRGVFRGWDDTALKCYVDFALHRTESGDVALKCPPWIESRIFSSWPRKLWPAISRLECETSLVMAEHTFSFARRSASRAERRNPQVSVLNVPGSHCFMQERPQETAQQVRQLLRVS